MAEKLMEQQLSRAHFRDPVAQQDHAPLGVESDLGDLHRLLNGAAQLLQFLHGDGFRHGNGDSDVRLELRALLRRILRDQDQPLAQRHDEARGGDLQLAQCAAAVRLDQARARSPGRLIVAIENDLERTGAGQLFELGLGVAAQVEVARLSWQLELGRWLKAAGLDPVRFGDRRQAGFGGWSRLRPAGLRRGNLLAQGLCACPVDGVVRVLRGGQRVQQAGPRGVALPFGLDGFPVEPVRTHPGRAGNGCGQAHQQGAHRRPISFDAGAWRRVQSVPARIAGTGGFSHVASGSGP
jgi:hypothetical protein